MQRGLAQLGRNIGRSCATLIGFVVASLALANETPTTFIRTGSMELSYGHESYTSPLIQFSNTGPLVRLDGFNRLAGHVTRVLASGTLGQQLADALTVQVNGSFQQKNSSQAPDLDFRFVGIEPMLSVSMYGGSLTSGASLQKIDVAGRPFRQRQSLHLDWTVGKKDDGYISYVIEHGINRHAPDFEDFDSVSSIALLRRQFLKPLPGLDEISVEAGVSKEANLRGFDNLSNKLIYTRITTGWDLFMLKMDLSWMHQYSRFEAPDLPVLPARRDHFNLFDLSTAYPVNKSCSLRLDLSRGRNNANSALFQSQYKGAMISVAIDI